MVKGFNGKTQGVCTICCCLALFLSIIATILATVAFSVLLDPLVKLPSNLAVGIEEVLHFKTLKADAENVKTFCETALTKCGVVRTQCPNPPAMTGSSDSSTEINQIATVFDSTLVVVQKVANDKFLGVGDFKVIADDLNVMHANLTTLKNTQQPIQCDITNDLFCTIHSKTEHIASSIATVRQGVDKITQSKVLKDYENYAEKANTAVHMLPFIMWVSMLFYFCFWYSARPSCAGGMKVCLACCFHGLFFTIAFILSLVFVVAGIVVTRAAAEITLDDPFSGKPTIAELIDHIQVNFVEFYNLVFRDLLDGMKKVFNAYVLYLIAQIVLAVHSCTCCCGIYVDEQKASG